MPHAADLLASNIIQPHLSTKLLRSIYNYLSIYHSVEIFFQICKELNVPSEYLLADDNWISLEFEMRFSELLRAKTNDPDILRKIGRQLLSPKIINPIEYHILRLATAERVFKEFDKSVSKFNLTCTTITIKNGIGEFEIKLNMLGAHLMHRDMAINFLGSFEALGDFYSLPNYSVKMVVAEDSKTVNFKVKYNGYIYYFKKFLKFIGFLTAGAVCAFGVSLLSQVGILVMNLVVFASLFAAVYFARKLAMILLAIEEHNSTYYKSSKDKTEKLHTAIQTLDKKINAERMVAHDIRSPLSVLNMILPSVNNQASAEQLQLVKHAIERINDVANDLLKQKTIGLGLKSVNTYSLTNVINNLISEKRLEVSNKKNINFVFSENLASMQNLKITDSEFSRVFSNLLNNSIEAIEVSGTIKIVTEQLGNKITIQIEDSGKGVPPEALKHVGNKGFTLGKKDGNGLGLFNALFTIKNAGGQFAFDSAQGLGTKVTITLFNI